MLIFRLPKASLSPVPNALQAGRRRRAGKPQCVPRDGRVLGLCLREFYAERSLHLEGLRGGLLGLSHVANHMPASTGFGTLVLEQKRWIAD